MAQQKTNNKKAFTLVELIVVVTILVLLSTIGFVSYTGYLTGVRDTNRISNLKSLGDSLERYRAKYALPLPEDSVDIKVKGKIISSQGYAGANLLDSLGFDKGGKDPKDDNYYSYYLTENRTYFQLIGFLEDSDTLGEAYDYAVLDFIGNSNGIDYSSRFPISVGQKLGFLTREDNTPVHEDLTIKSAGKIDLDTTNNNYIGYFNDGISLSGTGIVFSGIDNTLSAGGIVSSCKVFSKKSADDGVYLIAIKGYNPFSVYCDMTTAGGGWTLILKADGNNQTFTYASSYWTDTVTLNELEFNYDTTEFKSQLFSIMKLEEVHLQLVTNGESKYVSFDKNADSLFDVFNGGDQATEYGKDNWMSLVPGASMQPLCNLEGFNVRPNTTYGGARIGLTANGSSDCETNDSSIGIGIRPRSQYDASVGSNCGADFCSNGTKKVNSFGYLYIR